MIWDTFIGCTALFIIVGFFVIVLYLQFFGGLSSIQKQSEIDLRAWAMHERLTLVSYRRVKLGQAGFLTPALAEYRIVVEDSTGHRRCGWTSFVGGRTPPQWVRVRWEL
jgi:hypothetical protein